MHFERNYDNRHSYRKKEENVENMSLLKIIFSGLMSKLPYQTLNVKQTILFFDRTLRNEGTESRPNLILV